MAHESDHDDYCLEQYKYQYQPDLLRGKVAFITGGGSGIGFRMAELLMRHGCDVAIGSRRMDKLKEVGRGSVITFICHRLFHKQGSAQNLASGGYFSALTPDERYLLRVTVQLSDRTTRIMW